MKTYKKIKDIEKIEIAQYPLLQVTWNGSPALVKCRILSSAQIQACGEFSLIKTEKDKITLNKKYTEKEILEHAKIMHNVVKESLVSPTYEEITAIVKANKLWEKADKELKELKELCKGMPFNDIRRKQLEFEIDKKKIWVDLLLPDDFMAYIFCYALSLDRSEIDKITEEILLNCAILAEKWHKAPSDYYSGMFTEFNKFDFDRRALIALQEKRETKGNK